MRANREGEVIGAARAILRVLKSAGTDIHALADQVEQTDGGELSEAEMKKLYDAGYEAGRAHGVRAVEAKLRHDEDGFSSVDGIPSWHAMARSCQDRSARLRSSELGFVADMVGWTVTGAERKGSAVA